jgi:LuxR family transcriptional regulator, quorum-sensing system regulator CciR
METWSAATDFARGIATVVSKEALQNALADTCQRVGIRYFALSHHVDFSASPQALRVHNYPDGWEDWYDANRHGLTDPIHRASHFTVRGFYWREVPQLIPVNRNDRKLLGLGKQIGLGEGVTVPAHVPGEAHGSCSFVTAAGTRLPEDALPWAQTVGMFAFEVARRLQRRSQGVPSPRISERQRQCAALAGRGLTDRLIAGKLGIGLQSVMEHMREARARLGVGTRTQLVIGLLAAGELCIDDVWPRFHR